MHIDFVIPMWVVWTVGAIAGVITLALAAVGVFFINAFKDYRLF